MVYPLFYRLMESKYTYSFVNSINLFKKKYNINTVVKELIFTLRIKFNTFKANKSQIYIYIYIYKLN